MNKSYMTVLLAIVGGLFLIVAWWYLNLPSNHPLAISTIHGEVDESIADEKVEVEKKEEETVENVEPKQGATNEATQQTPPKQKEQPKKTRNDYFFKHSDTEIVLIDWLYDMSKEDLRYARNEIFARHGYVFEDKKMQAYFDSQAWYTPLHNNNAIQLSDLEQHNVNIIRTVEDPGFDYIIGDSHIDEYNYILPHSGSQRLSLDDPETYNLIHYSPDMIRYARNEIFARHGYIFDDQHLQDYFNNQSWYVPQTKNVSLSSIEQANVNFLKQYE